MDLKKKKKSKWRIRRRDEGEKNELKKARYCRRKREEYEGERRRGCVTVRIAKDMGGR